MKYPVNNKVILYSTLFITAAVTVPRLLALFREGVMARLAPFNMYEWLLQAAVSFVFCLVVFHYNKDRLRDFSIPFQPGRHGAMIFYNLLLVTVFAIAGGTMGRLLFGMHGMLPLNGYFARMVFIAVMIAIEFRILAAIYSVQLKEEENSRLRHANTTMELALLKDQLNPHFFFNALSSLSGIVREDPEKAQHYINHLSRIFRYSLHKSQHQLVSLKDELEEMFSYGELMKMRYEGGFSLSLEVAPRYHTFRLPHMSLQPLAENALKHNMITSENPLHIHVWTEQDMLIVSNNIRRKPFPEPGAGVGLHNLNNRFKILLQQEIIIRQEDGYFAVRLPLQENLPA